MKKIIILVLFPFIIFGQSKVNYKIFYNDNIEQNGLKIQISINLEKLADSTYFYYSNEVWGETNLTNCLKFIKADNPKYDFKVVSDSNRVVVYHPKEKKISFAYHIVQDIKEKSPKARSRPILEKDFFHILGKSLFIVPEQLSDSKIEDPEIVATIEWENFPIDYKIHNTFGTNLKKQILKVKLWTELYHSLFVGGDYRIYSFLYQKKPIEFAIRGSWLVEYQDERLLNTLKKTISTQRDFWKDNSCNYYTVIFTPTLTQNDSVFKSQRIKGSSVKNGFIIQSSNNPFNDFNRMKYIFNHEMMHNWIGGKISMKNEELNYWFSEGFTDYYTYKNRLRNNDFNFQEWISAFNKEVIKPHWENPEKNKPNYVIKDDFWKNKNIEKIPYRRGAIFAFWIDNQILKKSNYTISLDDLMREILKICETQSRKFTDDLFLDVSQKYLNEDIAYFFQKHILIGEDLELKSEDLIEDFKIEYENKIPKIVSNKEETTKFILK